MWYLFVLGFNLTLRDSFFEHFELKYFQYTSKSVRIFFRSALFHINYRSKYFYYTLRCIIFWCNNLFVSGCNDIDLLKMKYEAFYICIVYLNFVCFNSKMTVWIIYCFLNCCGIHDCHHWVSYLFQLIMLPLLLYLLLFILFSCQYHVPNFWFSLQPPAMRMDDHANSRLAQLHCVV